jgi:hypothetical protein
MEKLEITLDLSSEFKHFLKELLFMATLDDNVIALGTKIDTLTTAVNALSTAGVKVDLTAVLAAETGIQNTVNQVLAQTQPTPTPLTATVTGISPTSGSINGGETITVSGTNFTGATGVMFGLVAGTNLVVTNDTSLTVTSPAQPAGNVDVQVVDAAGTSAASPADLYTLS